MLYLILLSPFIAYLLYFLWQRWSRMRTQKRRAALLEAPFPSQWRQLLQEEFGLYSRLPAQLQEKLEGLMMVFIDEKVFAGRGGFEMTDRARVLVAAQACVLILNMPEKYYAGFETILIYPSAYQTQVTRQDGWVHTETTDHRAGEAWHRGPVILAWDHVQQGGRDGRDGHNVVMHEFAHKLDEENYHMDGLPILTDGDQYRNWAEVLGSAFQQLQEHRDEVIDAYGATSAAEFFAVVTEAFFEKGLQLKQQHPELYEQFRLYYRLDPAQWYEAMELKQRENI